MTYLWQKMLDIKKMRIVPKMILGYILLVVLPIILFGLFIYNQFNDNLKGNYYQSMQELVNQAANSLEVSLAQVESIHQLFQYNPQVIDYLSGQIRSEGEQVYSFMKDVRPVFSFSYSGNPIVRSVRILKNKDNVLTITGEIEPADVIRDSDIQHMLNGLKVNRGVWVPRESRDGSMLGLVYYRKIYNNQYTKELGILEIVVDNRILTDFFKSMKKDNGTGVWIMRDDRILYRNDSTFADGEITDVARRLASNGKNYLFWPAHKALVNSLDQKKLHLRFYFVNTTEDLFADIRNKSLFYGFALLVLLGLLSVIYYATASVLTKRVLRLARHMRNVDESNLTVYQQDGGRDEIGLLTHSYNSLIGRIDDLMNKVHRAELMKKEADYLVLQAQIKPHFLYNTLETIRMLAEIKDDEEVVEATYTLSKLLRYSLSSGGNDTLLTEEVDNIRYYLDIHKLRMADRLQFEIRVAANIADVRCPKFILQPLVENSIHHGISNSRKQGRIRVDIEDDGPFLKIMISDNGAGIPEDRLELIRGVLSNELDRSLLQTHHSGHGLYNVSERVRAFYGEHSSFELESRPGEGTTYILRLKR